MKLTGVYFHVHSPNNQGNDIIVCPRNKARIWGVGYDRHFVHAVRKVLAAEMRGERAIYNPKSRGI